MRLIGLLVILTLSIIPAPLAAEGQHATTGLAFHQAVTASAGLADPAKFERVERAAEETDVYVARTAALVIHLDEITTVVITREPVYADAASGTEAFRRRLGLPGQPQPIRITSYYYMATIHVDTHAARENSYVHDQVRGWMSASTGRDSLFLRFSNRSRPARCRPA